jgi:inosine triphosphate pyrophosphatase
MSWIPEETVFVSSSKNKYKELTRILGKSIPHIQLDLDEIQSLSTSCVAKKKAFEAAQKTKCPVIVEDVGLSTIVSGFPGALVKFFLATHTLQDIIHQYGNKEVLAECTYAFFNPSNGQGKCWTGVTKGTLYSPRGESFGFDPIFKPEGHDKTFAEMTPEEKDSVSHRRRAIDKMINDVNADEFTVDDFD